MFAWLQNDLSITFSPNHYCHYTSSSDVSNDIVFRYRMPIDRFVLHVTYVSTTYRVNGIIRLKNREIIDRPFFVAFCLRVDLDQTFRVPDKHVSKTAARYRRDCTTKVPDGECVVRFPSGADCLARFYNTISNGLLYLSFTWRRVARRVMARDVVVVVVAASLGNNSRERMWPTDRCILYYIVRTYAVCVCVCVRARLLRGSVFVFWFFSSWDNLRAVCFITGPHVPGRHRKILPHIMTV